MFTKIKHFMREHVFSRVSNSFSGDLLMYGIVSVFVILGPLFFIPTRAFSVLSSKGFFIFFIGIAGLLAYGIHVLKKGMVVFPRQKIFLILLLIILAGILGSLFAPGFMQAFLGYGFETTAGLFLVLFGFMAFLSYFVVRSYSRVGMLYGGMILVFIVLVLTHIIRYIVGPAFANMGVLGGATSTLMGSWSDLGIFFGFIVLFCVITLELAGLKKSFKWVIAGIGTLGTVLLLFMNIEIVWVVLGFVTLLLSLYLFSFAYWDTQAHAYKKTERVPWFTLGLFAVSVLAIFFGGLFNGLASKHQNLAWNDVRPSWGMTLDVAQKSLSHNFVTGYGPNSFSGVWSLVKPVTLSGGEPGRTDFGQGVGFIPTQIAINGILSAILWVLLSVAVIGLLVRKTRAGFASSIDRYFAIGLGISILYLSILAWVYVPGGYLLILLAILIGTFIALFDMNSEKSEYVFSFIKDPRASFFGILGITILIVGTVVLGYIGLRKTISFVQYTKGLVLLNQGKFAEANNRMNLAAAFAHHDIYHHQLAMFALSDVRQIVTKANSDKEITSKQAEQALGIALAHAQRATEVNRLDYNNWLLLGDVYRSMVGLGVTDAYDRALAAYKEAQQRSPHDSTIVLYFARLALVNKDTEGALGFVKNSIDQYPTADAYIVRAQIQLGQEKFEAAGESLKSALALDPYNADLAYQYGLLLLSQRAYKDAIVVLQRAVLINRNYAMAYVYLGYAYERAGDIDNANKVYDYAKQQFKGAADAIAAVRKGTIDQPSPTVAPDTTTDTSQLPAQKTVAPATKK